MKFAKVTDDDRDGRYRNSLRYIKPHSKVVDLGCGGGRLQKVLSRHDSTVKYIGVDNDREFVESARENGLDVRYFDIGDFSQLERFLREECPDVVFLMYVFYFLNEPEKLVETVSRHCGTVILGGKNHGHWVQRLRFLFGWAPATGEPLYRSYLLAKGEGRGFLQTILFAARNWPRDVNKSYPRIWTHKEYVAMFEELDLDWKLIGYRGFQIGNHYSRMLLGTLRAFGFQYALSKKGAA